MSRPRLYIDVDGVLFGLYGDPEQYQLRPGVNSFLWWASDHFECFWLTAWFGRINLFLRKAGFSRHFPVAQWSGNKTEGIDFDGEWYWIDDDMMQNEQDILEARGCLDRFIYVCPHGIDELERVRKKLQEKI